MFSKRTIVVLAILLTGGMIAASTAFAAGSGSSSQRPARKSDYTKAVAAVKAGNFSTAIALMEKVVAREGQGRSRVYRRVVPSTGQPGQSQSAPGQAGFHLLVWLRSVR